MIVYEAMLAYWNYMVGLAMANLSTVGYSSSDD